LLECKACKNRKRESKKEPAKAGAYKSFFGGIELAVFAGVEERHVGVGPMVAQIDFATIEGLRVNVDADGTLIEFREIDDFVDGLDGIHVGGMRGVEIVDVRRK